MPKNGEKMKVSHKFSYSEKKHIEVLFSLEGKYIHDEKQEVLIDIVYIGKKIETVYINGNGVFVQDIDPEHAVLNKIRQEMRQFLSDIFDITDKTQPKILRNMLKTVSDIIIKNVWDKIPYD